MIKKKDIFLAVLFFGLTFLGFSQAKAEVKLTTKVDKHKVAVGEKIVLTATLEWEQVEKEEIKVAAINPPECSILELVDSSQASNSELRGDRVITSQVLEYVFRATKEGVGKISALSLEYTVAGGEEKFSVSSEPIEIKVISLKGKLISNFGFISVVIAGVFAVAMGVFLFFKSRKKKQKPGVLNEGADVRYEREAIDRLVGATKYRVGGNFKEYYSQLHYILADYTRAKYHIRIKNKSEDEIRRLSSGVNITGELLRLLIETASLSEKVRFSGYEVGPDEERRVFSGIERYLRSRIPEEEEKIDLAEEDKNEEV